MSEINYERITVSIPKDIVAKVRKKQAKLLTELQRSVSFSEVLAASADAGLDKVKFE